MSLANQLGQRISEVAVIDTDGDTSITGVVQGLDLITANQTATVVFNSQGQSETVVNTSATTIGSLAVTFPSVSVPGQVLSYYTHGTLTAVVPTGGTLVGTAWSAGAADSTVSFKAINGTGTFVRTK